MVTLGGVAGAICASSLLVARVSKIVSEVVCASSMFLACVTSEVPEVVASEGVAVCAGAGGIGRVLSLFVFMCAEKILKS